MPKGSKKGGGLETKSTYKESAMKHDRDTPHSHSGVGASTSGGSKDKATHPDKQGVIKGSGIQYRKIDPDSKDDFAEVPTSFKMKYQGSSSAFPFKSPMKHPIDKQGFKHGDRFHRNDDDTGFASGLTRDEEKKRKIKKKK